MGCDPCSISSLATQEDIAVESDGSDQEGARQSFVPEGGDAEGDQRLVDRIEKDNAEGRS
jgi:hypothetical protein